MNTGFSFDPTRIPSDERFAEPIPTPPTTPEVLSNEEIEEAALEGSIVLSKLFGFDRLSAEEKLKEDFTFILGNYNFSPGTKVTAMPGVTVGKEGGNWISPGQLVTACNRQYNVHDIPELTIWENMHIKGRAPDWWNKTIPNKKVGGVERKMDPHTGDFGVYGLILFDEMRGLDMALKAKTHEGVRPIKGQQEQLHELVEASGIRPVVLEALSIANWLMLDQLSIQKKEERPNIKTVNRFIQHGIDRTVLRDSYCPAASVPDDRATLTGSKGKAGKNVGYYTVLGRNSSSHTSH